MEAFSSSMLESSPGLPFNRLQQSENAASLVKPWTCDKSLTFPFKYSIKKSPAYGSEKTQHFLSHHKSWKLHRIDSSYKEGAFSQGNDADILLLYSACKGIFLVLELPKKDSKKMIKSDSQLQFQDLSHAVTWQPEKFTTAPLSDQFSSYSVTLHF